MTRAFKQDQRIFLNPPPPVIQIGQDETPVLRVGQQQRELMSSSLISPSADALICGNDNQILATQSVVNHQPPGQQLKGYAMDFPFKVNPST